LKIKSLKVVGLISGINLLLQKVGPYLEHLELGIWEGEEKAFEYIINSCDKIQFLYFYGICYEKIIPQLFKLIHINKYLKYLSL